MQVIHTVAAPTQRQVLAATCGYATELRWNEEVLLVYWGEDGPGLVTQRTREFFAGQPQASDNLAEFQSWYIDELVDALWAGETIDAPEEY